MSDTMLLGVLCMPPEMWDDSALDVTQRYGRYMQAAHRIEEDARELEQLRAKVQAQALQILALIREVAELARDAERYRWLREQSPSSISVIAWRVPVACNFADPDAAIDAAIAGAHAESKVE